MLFVYETKLEDVLSLECTPGANEFQDKASKQSWTEV